MPCVALAGSRAPAAPRAAMQDRYDAMVRERLATFGVRVRKWRTNSSGVAVLLRYRDGSLSRYLEAPRPTGPVSAAIFLHEIGHHAIGLGSYKPRCLEEYHAWMFALREMERLELNITDAVRRRVHRSLRYAVRKARRRGIKTIPPELLAFDTPTIPASPVIVPPPWSGLPPDASARALVNGRAADHPASI
ncbi:MAG: hypothetical protein SFZ23_12570 [Planctomycetota bacterium]|nr:hypothetical protein [Planctomycetota bacterium]